MRILFNSKLLRGRRYDNIKMSCKVIVCEDWEFIKIDHVRVQQLAAFSSVYFYVLFCGMLPYINPCPCNTKLQRSTESLQRYTLCHNSYYYSKTALPFNFSSSFNTSIVPILFPCHLQNVLRAVYLILRLHSNLLVNKYFPLILIPVKYVAVILVLLAAFCS